MDFRRKNDEEDDEDETVSYNPHTIHDSAFPKPLLPSSSSLIAGRSATTSVAAGVLNGTARNASSDLAPSTEGVKIPSLVKYRECLRNHAASHGGHVLDGCGEYMPSSADAMKCAACGCHRSFHRREGESDNLFYLHHNSRNRGNSGARIPLLLPAPHQKHINPFSSSPFTGMVAFGNTSGGTTTTDSSSEELGLPTAAVMAGGVHMPFVNPSSKKRFRTKFASEQKVKMIDFAEKIGWRIQRQNEAEMDAFCAELGVSRQVFKVWMHNNKHSMRKQHEQQQQQQQQQPELHQTQQQP